MSIGRWILKTFEKTDVNEIMSELQRLQNEVSNQKECIRQHKANEDKLSADIQLLQQSLTECQKQLSSTSSILVSKNKELDSKKS